MSSKDILYYSLGGLIVGGIGSACLYYYFSDEEKSSKKKGIITRNLSEGLLYNEDPQSGFGLPTPGKYYNAKSDGKSKTSKLVVIMVGLPCRGKTYIARKIARYLRWINYKTTVFCLAKYRLEEMGPRHSEFFDPANTENYAKRMQTMQNALEDLLAYLHRDGDVAILDGTNTTLDRRQKIRERVAQEKDFKLLWIESMSDHDLILEETSIESPDYLNPADHEKRVNFYKQNYTPLSEKEGTSYIKIIENCTKFEMFAIQGFVPAKIAAFVLNIHSIPRPILLVRHGESEYNARGLLGGDSELTERGQMFAKALAAHLSSPESGLDTSTLCVWSSCLKRAIATASLIPCDRYIEWQSLREIEAGECDGLSPAQIRSKFPEESRACMKDILRYRYPRAENYLDVIARLEPLIFELEQSITPIVIVAHQAVLRCLYSYFMDVPAVEIPHLSMPLHTIISLEPRAYGCKENRSKIILQDA